MKIEYNPFLTLGDLETVGIDVTKIIELSQPCFRIPSQPKIGQAVKAMWLTEEVIQRINNSKHPVYWFPKNGLDPNEYDRDEFQRSGILGMIRLSFAHEN